MSRPYLWLPGFAAATSFAPLLCAQEAEQPDAETYTPAVPIERAAPIYPRQFAISGREGWVLVSYVIGEDGSVIEPMIEDSSGSEPFEQAALRAVEEWRYEPATSDGKPVEQSMTQAKIVFQLVEGPAGVSRDFQRTLERISNAIVAGELAQAGMELTELEYAERRNLAEDAWFWWHKFMYLEAAGAPDPDEKIDSLRKALGYEVEYLSPDTVVAAAQRLYVLEVQSLDLSAAIGTYEKLRDSSTARRSAQYAPALTALQPSYQQIMDAVAGPNTLVFRATIDEFGYWVHDLLRRSFSLANVHGRVEVVDVRCTRGNRRFRSFAADAVWTVPESWGECGVYIGGDEGTSFSFEEYADAAAVPEAAPTE